MTTSRDESRAIFERAIEHTRGLSPATFDQWFGGVQFDDLTDGVLSLRVQNEFVLEWVKTNFLPTITDKIRELTGWSVQVAWTIDQHLEAPIANVPQMPPVRPRSLVVRSSTNPPAAPASPSPPVAAEPRAPAPAPAPLRRPALPDDLNPKHTFATFVVGPSNQLAHAAAIAAAGGGGRRYNPLFICGGTGLGKTHLVHAIAHRVLDERPGARIIYVSAERFTNDFITAIQHHRMDDFRAKYRVHCDLLLVDDIQFLAGREQTQEEFFHTFNALHGLDRQIVVTSDKYPQNLERMEERLVSRFSWGLVADIQAPELETRVAIVRNKAALEGIVLPDDVALYLAQVIRSNVRELEGTLIRLAAKSSLTGRPVDLAFARAEITAATPRAQIMSVEDIQRAVCHHFHLRSIDLTSKDRHKSIAFARHVAMYLCKQRLKVSFPEIGRAFGNRDHTTVMSAVRKIEAQRDTDPQVRAHLEALERKLAGDS
ncbi:chromosomal replication initiator protein DnaA [Polyangium sorediatum]|uniref:Chromosomal replication initiator protein DnaA n=1 Tax=Polyangium sorediatum TaxID=889274 RepID=A0ABT6NTD1_9BACT|nr:chromosomal replication initiator protein DnaA [Polyangium sorediatum]MDI1431571.1 chromosomal replication initiator protein DnaA [Polyangium sorediatum]